jgi:hypothetical protein
MQISNQRIRLAVDTSQMASINDAITGASPQFWNGVDLEIELAFFYGTPSAATLVDVSNFDSITVDLKESDPRTGLPLMSQTIASGSINDAMTYTQWTAGLPASCQVLAIFTNEETNLDLSSDSVTYWLVISGLTNDTPGHKVILGATPLIVQEGGAGVEPPASVVNPTYYTAAQSDARYTLSVNLTTINNEIATLNTGMTAVTATANAALPLAGGTLTGALTITGLSGVLQATSGLISGSATTSVLTEGTNLYFTNTRALAAVATITGAASGICPLDSNSLVPVANIPAIALTTTFVVASQAAMLAESSATVGDLCIRTDLSQTFILTATPPSTPGNWTQLLNPSSDVTSVNTLTGAVTLTTSNIAEGTNEYFTTARANAAALAAALTGFSAASGGSVTSADTILSALGKYQYRVAAIESAFVNANGSVAMTGMLNFTGTGNAGIQLSNLTDTQRAALSALDGMLIYNTTLSAIQYYNGAWLTLATGGNAAWYNGSGAPASTIGNNGDYYLNTANGSICQKASGAWAVIFSYANTLNGTTGGTIGPSATIELVGSSTGGVAEISWGPYSRMGFANFNAGNPVCGTATLNGTTAVTINSIDAYAGGEAYVFLSNVGPAGTPGIPYLASMSNGSFTIKSTSSSDTSEVIWLLVNADI